MLHVFCDANACCLLPVPVPVVDAVVRSINKRPFACLVMAHRTRPPLTRPFNAKCQMPNAKRSPSNLSVCLSHLSPFPLYMGSIFIWSFLSLCVLSVCARVVRICCLLKRGLPASWERGPPRRGELPATDSRLKTQDWPKIDYLLCTQRLSVQLLASHFLFSSLSFFLSSLSFESHIKFQFQLCGHHLPSSTQDTQWPILEGFG